MNTPLTIRAVKARTLQPVLSLVARRNADARALAAAMQMTCAACHTRLVDHVGPRNRWKGCPGTGRTGGAR
jgi:cytochrome c551/c552